MPVWMMAPLKVRRSTMAAQSRGSVKVFVQPLNLSFEAMATLFLPHAPSEPGTAGSTSAVKFLIAEFIDA